MSVEGQPIFQQPEKKPDPILKLTRDLGLPASAAFDVFCGLAEAITADFGDEIIREGIAADSVLSDGISSGTVSDKEASLVVIEREVTHILERGRKIIQQTTQPIPLKPSGN